MLSGPSLGLATEGIVDPQGPLFLPSLSSSLSVRPLALGSALERTPPRGRVTPEASRSRPRRPDVAPPLRRPEPGGGVGARVWTLMSPRALSRASPAQALVGGGAGAGSQAGGSGGCAEGSQRGGSAGSNREAAGSQRARCRKKRGERPKKVCGRLLPGEFRPFFSCKATGASASLPPIPRCPPAQVLSSLCPMVTPAGKAEK